MTYQLAPLTMEQMSAPSGDEAFAIASSVGWNTVTGYPGQYQTFASIPGLTAGDTIPYYGSDTASPSNTEVGIGTWTSGSLARTTIVASSNGGAACNFSGTVTLRLFPMAADLNMTPQIPSSGNLTVSTVGPAPANENVVFTTTTPGSFEFLVNASNMAAGFMCQALWANSTAYVVGNYIQNGSNAYYCTGQGTSASTGTGPSGTGTDITDGSVTWNYVGTPQDVIELRTYLKVNSSDTLACENFMTLPGAQTMEILRSPVVISCVEAAFSLTQVLGIAKTFQWSVFQV